MIGSPTDLSCRCRVLRYQVQVRAAPSNNHGCTKRLAKHHRGNAVGIKVVRVDQIEIEAAAAQFRNMRPNCPIHQRWTEGHTELRNNGKTRVSDRKTEVILLIEYRRQFGILTEQRVFEGKPRNRRHDPHIEIDTVASAEFAQLQKSLPNKKTTMGKPIVGKKRAEG